MKIKSLLAILAIFTWVLTACQSALLEPTATPVPTNTLAPTIDLNGVSVTFVSNSGFLITVGDQKVLIDALFEGSPPDTVQTLLLNAKPPLDDVDLILATHNHPDHFSATLVQQYMENNSKAIFMSTKQAASQLTGFGDRVIIIEDPVVGSPVNVEVNGIGVEAIYLNHGYPPNDPSEVFNSGYVVTIDPVKFFHSGDIGDLQDARQYNLAEQKIDLAFIQHFFLLDDNARSLIDKVVGAKYLFPIHYKFTTPAFDEYKIKNYFPDAIIFSSELESWPRSLPTN
ncbi:MAG: MBL fold metallo-hydrolase [Anaerolineales bacterium]|nr:MBL fold metallo-hydrolase [Anaerolineales bacterium]